MSRFPDFKFVCSQMQQLEWVRQDYPALFSKLQEAQLRGQFIPIGATWVEMDGNMPSGESMVRQFLYGQAFLKKHFKSHSSVFWLPDTFGYSGQLPQIMQHCKVPYFLSQKLSWNNINKFPHNTFKWCALDGQSKVLAHFPPANTYGSDLSVKDLSNTTALNKDKDRTTFSSGLLLYGHGDGGGGPTEGMLMRSEFLKDCDAVGRLEHIDPHIFFEKVEEQDGHKLLEWCGELYFELHRGTYTSQAACKQFNRRCEGLLQSADFISVLLGKICKQEALHKALLESSWKTILLNQFHDVLPGSSISKVYKDAVTLYEKVQYSVGRMIFDCMRDIVQKEGDELSSNTLTIFNSLPYTRSEVIKVPYDENTLAVIENIPPFSFKTVSISKYSIKEEEMVKVLFCSPHFCLENKYVNCCFDHKGRLVSFYDKVEQRECLEAGHLGNQFLLFEDVPIFWDAWDVELYHLEKYQHLDQSCEMKIKSTGTLTASLERTVIISEQSKITQLISLDCLSPRLTFETRVEWYESRKMLKVEFPVAIHSDQAVYETQYGLINRPARMNTSWDVARFEVCGLRFMALQEHNYGVALLSDSKYGYSVAEKSKMRLSLLRAPKDPDPECDVGEHVFKFALMPFTSITKVLPEASRLCSPLLWWTGADCTRSKWAESSLVSCSGTLIIDCIKEAESSPKDIIIRAYESVGGRGQSILKVHPLLSVAKVDVCNGLEEESGVSLSKVAENEFVVQYRPFQVYTLKILCLQK
jgi:alpha-mannosidase